MNFKTLGLLIATASIIMLGNTALAVNPGDVQTGEETKNKNTGKKLEIKNEIQSRFCEKISELTNGLQNRIAEREKNILEKRDERLAGLEENAAERDAKISERRTLRDQNMEEHFQSLSEKAQAEVQKDAAKKFQEAVQNAIEVRRNAMDTAIESFREGVARLHEERKNYLDTEADKYRDMQEQALEAAKTACQNNENAASVRQNLKNSLKLAKNNFSAERKNAEKIQTQMKVLIQTRKQDIEKANSDFKAAVDKARTELKAAFASGFSDNQ